MWVFKWLCTLSVGVTTRMLSSFNWEIWISFVSSLVSEFHSLPSQSHQFWGDLNLFRYNQSQCYYLLNLKGQNIIFASTKFGPETFMVLPCIPSPYRALFGFWLIKNLNEPKNCDYHWLSCPRYLLKSQPKLDYFLTPAIAIRWCMLKVSGRLKRSK